MVVHRALGRHSTLFALLLFTVAALPACKSDDPGGAGKGGSGGGGAGGSGGRGGSGGGGSGGGSSGGGSGMNDARTERPQDAGKDSKPDAAAPSGAKRLENHVLTWYTFQDNTPVNSAFTGSGRPLKAFVSVAIPRRELKENGGTLDYGDKLWVEFLAGRTMPDGTAHTGWVEITDFCGDAGDDTYCYQEVGASKYPNVDLYIGDFTKSGTMKVVVGMGEEDCLGPAGSGQDLTEVYSGNPGANFKTSYGGATLGTGKCGDKTAARQQQKGTNTPGEGTCWGYDDQDSAQACDKCTATTCAGR
jgi:hypothetical protein